MAKAVLSKCRGNPEQHHVRSAARGAAEDAGRSIAVNGRHVVGKDVRGAKVERLVAFRLVLFQAWAGGALSFGKSALAFIASLVPFGPFLIDRFLAKSAPSGYATD